ncbi:MAG: dihydroorotate dehydrogenase [Bacillota bacterium]|nr:dihydroorotate dehydrogenase [Bacillota bacterium]
MHEGQGTGVGGGGPDLSVNLAGIRLANPVLVASGTFGYGREMARWFDLRLLGGIITKGTTLAARPGNPPPRIAETPAGLLNSIGLENPGVDAVIGEEIPFLRQFGVPVIVNIAGETVEEYATVAAKLEGVEGVSGLEVNVSCPNVRAGGMVFGTDPAATAAVVKAVRAATSLPLLVKLTPNVTDIVEVARAAQEAGADALTLVNTLKGMAIDVQLRRPLLGAVTGGLSGPAIKPVALRMVWEVAGAVNLPIVGCGGIMSGRDAVEFLLAGASAVAVGSATLVNPLAAPRVVREMAAWLAEEGFAGVSEVVGMARGPGALRPGDAPGGGGPA